MRLSQVAGWNQTPEDWQRLLEVEPAGCFALVEDGTLAATTTAVCFGRELAWIGMVLTDPSFRRRGFARQLMECALEFLERRELRWIKLDATEMGRPLYERLGFADECGIERWRAVAKPRMASAGMMADSAGLEACATLDRAAFGVDRRALLDRLARDAVCSLPGEGFAMARLGANAATFGPCVAGSAAAARCLLEWFLAKHAGEPVFWDILPENQDAVRLAKEYGFEPLRKLIRMVKPGVEPGERLAVDNSLVYSTAGFEYG